MLRAQEVSLRLDLFSDYCVGGLAAHVPLVHSAARSPPALFSKKISSPAFDLFPELFANSGVPALSTSRFGKGHGLLTVANCKYPNRTRILFGALRQLFRIVKEQRRKRAACGDKINLGAVLGAKHIREQSSLLH